MARFCHGCQRGAVSAALWVVRFGVRDVSSNHDITPVRGAKGHVAH